MNKANEALLAELLECGIDDLVMLDDIDYDLTNVVDHYKENGETPTLNDLLEAVFERGQTLIVDGWFIELGEREDELEQMKGNLYVDHVRKAELEEEIEELNALNPWEDIEWYCNCLDTSWWMHNADTYRKYLGSYVKEAEKLTGFELKEV